MSDNSKHHDTHDIAEHAALIVEPRAQQIDEEDPHAPKIGRWYWVGEKVEHDVDERPYVIRMGEDDDGEPDEEPKKPKSERWLGCVTKVGSNFVEIRGVFGKIARIHLNEFYEQCELEPDSENVLASNMEDSKNEAFALMYKVREITSRLAITPGRVLTEGSQETQALAVRDGKRLDEYKADLVRAEETELPALFEQIKGANRRLERWMSAKLIPMEAEANQLQPAIGAVKQRIFSVKLYAGLVEEVVQIRDGEPAPLNEPVHVIQRRAYMDEECLANYEAGGMDYKGIRDFDRWLARKDNRDRVMPFPRCIIAFQVRRNRKDRGVAITLGDFWRMEAEEKLDKLTFLYIRNGSRMFRLSTEIEFGKKLFPDMDKQPLADGTPYAKVSHYSNTGEVKVHDVVSEHRWKGMREAEREWERNDQKKRLAYDEEQKKLPKKDRRDYWSYGKPDMSSGYERFTPDNVHYDEIAKFLADQIEFHNRLVLVIQGLLDRSPALHPHPPWSLWTDKDFKEGLRLVYDDDRALTPGDAPDFDAYYKRLGASIEAGSVTIGQELAWMRLEAIKENERIDRRDRRGGDRHVETYRPYGDSGPGKLAQVARMDRKGRCVFTWTKTKRVYGEPEQLLPRHVTINPSKLFNVSAYKPGDFKQFFADPRTRADYLQWAPLLLVAEDFHAGKREAQEPTTAEKKTKPRGRGDSFLRHRREQRARLNRQAVELARDITLKKGDVLKKGTLFRVSEMRGNECYITGINEDGTYSNDNRSCSNAHPSDLLVRPDIPRDPRDVKDEQLARERIAKAKKERAEALAREMGDIPEQDATSDDEPEGEDENDDE